MRLIAYITNKEVYPLVITKDVYKTRLDILKNDSVSLANLSKGYSYSKESIMLSIVYDRTTKITDRFGNNYLLSLLAKKMQLESFKNLIVSLDLVDEDLGDGIFINKYTILQKKNNATKIRGIDYVDGQGKFILHNIEDYYERYGIKNLEYFRQTKILKLDEKDYKCLNTYDKISDYVASVDWSTIEYTASDTETTGLNFFFNSEKPDEIVGISHSYKDKQAVYIPLRHKGQILLDIYKVFDMLKPINKTKLIWQNGSFDLRVFRRYGLRAKLDCELTALFHLINSDKHKSKALKDNARLLLGEDTIELDEILGPNFDARLVEYIDLDLITVYACADADYTLRIFKILIDWIAPITRDAFFKDMCNYRRVALADWYGFPINIESLNRTYQNSLDDKKIAEEFMLDYIYKQAASIEIKRLLEINKVPQEKITEEVIAKFMETTQINNIMKKKLIGTRSNTLELEYDADKMKILYRLLKYPKLRYTKKGNKLSVGKDYFKDINLYEHDSAQNIFKESIYSNNKDKSVIFDKDIMNLKTFPLGYMFIEYAKICNKIKNYKRLKDTYNCGRSISEYNYNGTETYRITNAVQTIPCYAKEIIGYTENDKWGIIDFDFDQIELRNAENEALRLWESIKSNDNIPKDLKTIILNFDCNKIIDAYNNVETDIHTENTAMFYGLTPAEVTPELRRIGKTVDFSGIYGASGPTMSKEELCKAKSLNDRQKIIQKYENARNAWLSTHIYLYHYLDVTKDIGLQSIPKEKIPFNIESEEVGMTMSRSGRPRYYDLSNLNSWRLAKISNQGRNQFIQTYSRDILFLAIDRLEKALYESGLDETTIRSILFVHDEDGMEYDKTVIHPLWLAAMVYKYCCMEIDGHPIKYYCSPAIGNTWGETKDDKYEIPKKMLAKLSTNRGDYEPLTDLNHRDYVYNKIKEYYQDEIIQMFKDNEDMGVINLESIDLATRYAFINKIKNYTNKVIKITDNQKLNNMLNVIGPVVDRLDNIELVYKGAVVDKDLLVNLNIEVDEDNIVDYEQQDYSLLDDDFDFDSLEDIDDVEDSIDNVSLAKTVINMKTLEELNKKYINISSLGNEHVNRNVIVEVFMNKVMILLSRTETGFLRENSINKIKELLNTINCEKGRDVYILMDGSTISTGLKVPYTFKSEKFDDYIEGLRVKSGWKNS